jgi:hypothetical protein
MENKQFTRCPMCLGSGVLSNDVGYAVKCNMCEGRRIVPTVKFIDNKRLSDEMESKQTLIDESKIEQKPCEVLIDEEKPRAKKDANKDKGRKKTGASKRNNGKDKK